MQTSRKFLCHELYGDSKLICKCCGKEVKTSLEIKENCKTVIIKYECHCKGWNDIIETKNKIEKLNREFNEKYKEYEKLVRQNISKIYNDYGLKLQDEIWLKEANSIKGKNIKRF